MTRSCLLAAVLLAGCPWAEQPARDAGLDYRGDGAFVDHGPRMAAERYVLDLGAIDLAAAGTRG